MSDYYDLGTYSRRVTTNAPAAQRWFDRGLTWLYGYNHDEAVKCFRKALEHDPHCLMAHWGVAYGLGCNYNKQWEAFAPKALAMALRQGRAAILEAYAHLDRATAVETALIKALEKRFQRDDETDVEVLETWNDQFAAAMRDVYRAFPDDWDVAALFAEALMNRTPWQLWDLETGEPAEDADTLEAIAVVERALDQVEESGAQPHPGLLHLYIHLLEMSPQPERAMRAADQLRDLAPDAGHLLHMPSHIDVLCGQYYNAIVANRRAIAVDNVFAARDGILTDYTFYRAHNIHFKVYAAMLLGQFKTALEAADEIADLANEELLRIDDPPMADHLEGILSMRLHVLVRFGKWREILAEPAPVDEDLYCNSLAMRHYARAIALATLHEHEAAAVEVAAFEAAQAKVPDTRFIFNNNCIDVLEVAAAMMQGEVAYHRGDTDCAFGHLRQAVYLDDHLEFAEPWGWAMPTRHALGALLLECGQVEEALAVYRADLGLDRSLCRAMQRPNNVWSLQGFVTCLERLDRIAEADLARPQLQLALARADVEIETSCFCATGNSRHGSACCHEH